MKATIIPAVSVPPELRHATEEVLQFKVEPEDHLAGGPFFLCLAQGADEGVRRPA